MNQSRPEAKLSTSDPFAVQPQYSLCDLHGLRAMLSLRRVFLGGNATKAVCRYSAATTVWVQPMKVIIIITSLSALAPMVRADEVVVRHEPTVIVHDHYAHHYAHHPEHHDVVVIHPN
jgi:hypothetical protein